MRKLTTEEFKQRFVSRYGDVYNLDKVDYINNKTEVIVTCKIHGDFLCRPDSLLDGARCPKCSKTRGLTEKEFVEKANIVHNGFYSYDNCGFINVSSKVKITCPIHGEFYQKANNHLNGYCCPKCNKENVQHKITKLEQKNKSTKKYSTNEFIEKARQVHEDKYAYDKTKYVNNKSKVTITCLEHGDFEITPNHFLKGRGCPKCSKNYRMTNNEFIERCN